MAHFRYPACVCYGRYRIGFADGSGADGEALYFQGPGIDGVR